MQSRDLFGVALRVMGVWFLYQAAYGAVFLAMQLSQIVNSYGAQGTEGKILIAFHLLVALILLAFAEKIVGLVYGSRPAA